MLCVRSYDFFSALSAYLCVLCVKPFLRLVITQRTQRYAESAEKKSKGRANTFGAKPVELSNWTIQTIHYLGRKARCEEFSDRT